MTSLVLNNWAVMGKMLSGELNYTRTGLVKKSCDVQSLCCHGADYIFPPMERVPLMLALEALGFFCNIKLLHLNRLN